MLLEDAFVIRDQEALTGLFEDGAVLVSGHGPQQARGSREIERLATAMWSCDQTYVADSRRVLQARDTTLLVAERGINVVRRGRDGTWRFVISLLSLGDTTKSNEQ